MKKYFIILISLFVFGFANAQRSNLVFFTENGEEFTLFLNGVMQNKIPKTNVKATNLNVQNYHAKVVFKNRVYGQVAKNIFFNKGKETSYAIKRNKKGVYTFKFRGEIPVSRSSRSSASRASSRNAAKPSANSRSSRNSAKPSSSSTTVTYRETTTSSSSGESGVVNSVNMKVSDSEATTRNASSGNDSRGSVNIIVSENDNGVDFNLKVRDDGATTKGAPSNTTTTTTTTTTATTSNSGNPGTTKGSYQRRYETNYNEGTKCNSPMKHSDFVSAKRTIASKSFEDSKLKIAKQITSSNCLLASQVKEIMQIFGFESTRVKYAKYAYAYTYDVGNYFKVNDAFEYESSIDELDEFINSQK
ncbi:MAG: DUF4476 domain-containing protein [Bacteroidales bacterium]|nr:DUF4476 domain-containing protein [Bacteroidales bacterium]